MRTRKAVFLFASIAFILLSHYPIEENFTFGMNELEDYKPLLNNSSPSIDSVLDYIGVEEMRITSDEDFVSLGFAGSGTIEDPYRIENYQIGHSGITLALLIRNITKHFVINHCRIAATYSLDISNIPGVCFNITNNIMTNLGSYYPIDIHTVIKIENCNNVIIADNDFESFYRGLDIRHCSNITIDNNIFSEGKQISPSLKFAGISLIDSSNCVVRNNIFYSGGVLLESDYNLLNTIIMDNNTLDGSELAFFDSENSLTISTQNYGQIILFDCYDVVIENQQILDVYYGISVFYSEECKINNNILKDCYSGVYETESSNCQINNNLCDNNTIGISVVNSEGSTLKDNTCFNAYMYHGISVDGATNTWIEGNNCSMNELGYGIYESSSNSTIIDNVCEFNSYGIHLWSSINPIVLNNLINRNNGGLWALDVSNAKFYNNSISFNTKFGGIKIQNGHSGSISYNLILENVGYGALLMSSTSNYVVHHNSFINNPLSEEASSQAYDEGTDNYWYLPETSTGNFWSDKGIGGKYYIDGSANSVDLFPLKEPPVEPGDDYVYKTSLHFIAILIAFVLPCILHIKRKSNKNPS